MPAAIPSFVWAEVLAACLAVPVTLAIAVRRYGSPRRAAGLGAVLGAWFVAAVVLGGTGLFAGAVGPAPAVVLGVAPPLAGGILALTLSRRLREAAVAIPQAWLVSVQTARVVGAVFLVVAARGGLPRQFALPAGWGDVAVGALAPFVALSLSRGWPHARGAAVAWNALGLLDLTVALATGALSSNGPLQLLAGGPSTAAMGRLPLSLIPSFGVPLFLLLHVVSLLALRGTPARVGAGAGPGAGAATLRPAPAR